MAKLDGTVLFGGLFTVVNELEQIRYQAFVPTKALEHVKAGLRGIGTSLAAHGLSQPCLAFTDNVHSDYATGVECLPSLSHGVSAAPPRSTGLDFAELPSSIAVYTALTPASIDNACQSVLAQAEGVDGASRSVPMGVKVVWQYRTGSDELEQAQQISWVILGLAREVHLLWVSVHLDLCLLNNGTKYLNSRRCRASLPSQPHLLRFSTARSSRNSAATSTRSSTSSRPTSRVPNWLSHQVTALSTCGPVPSTRGLSVKGTLLACRTSSSSS